MDALPVYQDVGGWLGLREDGRIVALDSETGRVFTADERWTLVGLVYAAKKHATLALVLPPRPSHASTCDQCDGVGFVMGKFVCGQCNGIGWVGIFQ